MLCSHLLHSKSKDSLSYVGAQKKEDDDEKRKGRVKRLTWSWQVRAMLKTVIEK